MLTQNLAEFWENLYNEDNDYWNTGEVSPQLLEFFDHPLCPREGRILAPGAGYGLDAQEWADRGYETLAVDFCANSIDALDMLTRNSKNKNLSVLDYDLFDLTPEVNDIGQFDYIYDFGTFSAIHPGRRDEYFEVWLKMLKDDGRILAFFYPIENSGNPLQGPPHPTSEGELHARLGGLFDIEKVIPLKSTPADRKGKEELWILKKSQ